MTKRKKSTDADKPKIKAAKKKALRRAPRPERTGKPQTKTQVCLVLLAQPEGASLAELQEATGWQKHSVHGCLAGKIKKLPGLTLISEKPAGGIRRYRVERAPA